MANTENQSFKLSFGHYSTISQWIFRLVYHFIASDNPALLAKTRSFDSHIHE